MTFFKKEGIIFTAKKPDRASGAFLAKIFFGFIPTERMDLMKKIKLAIVLVLSLAFILISCSNKDGKAENAGKNEVKEIIQETENTKKDDKNIPSFDGANIAESEEVSDKELHLACQRLGFENENLLFSLCNALGKDSALITQEDIENIHYIAIGDDGAGNYSLFAGYVDYVDTMFSPIEDENEILSLLNEHVMSSDFVYDKTNKLTNDLAKFKNLEVFELYDITINDVSFIKNYENLALGYFKNNSITDVSSLSDYNPDTLIELDFTGNDISDWSPLYSIKEKVTIYYDISTGFTSSLSDLLEEEQEKHTESVGDSSIVFVDGDGNETNLGSLFD